MIAWMGVVWVLYYVESAWEKDGRGMTWNMSENCKTHNTQYNLYNQLFLRNLGFLYDGTSPYS